MSILNRAWATIEDHADVAQLVERDLAKVEVAGSSPVVRSSQRPGPCDRDALRLAVFVAKNSEMPCVIDFYVYPVRERLS